MEGVRRGAAAAYRYLTPLFFAACIVQIFLAGRGVFGMRTRETGGDVEQFFEDQTSLDPHRALGLGLGGVAVILLLLALVAWTRKDLIGWFFLLAVMAFLIQSLTSYPDQPWVGALHPLDGVGILALSGWLSWRFWRGADARTSLRDA